MSGSRPTAAVTSAERFDYVTVGHVTRDLIEGPSGRISQVGGSAFYSALQASRLGLRTLIVTQGVRDEIEDLLSPYRDELALYVIDADRTTTLSTAGSGASRSQRICAWAGPISLPLEIHCSILHLAPVAHEGRISWGGEAIFVGITPQGLIRRWQALPEVDTPRPEIDAAQPGADTPRPGEGSPQGDVPTARLGSDSPWRDISPAPLAEMALPAYFDAAVIGELERRWCDPLFAAAQRVGASVAVTAGERPTTVHTAGSSVVQSTIPPVVEAHEDIGAGDVFSAAFFIALAKGHDALAAAEFGNAAAAVRIAGVGPGAIGDRTQVETAWRCDASRDS